MSVQACPWIPVLGFDYCGSPETLELSLPCSWEPVSASVGGWDRAASGVQEAFQIRRDRGLRLRLLFYEEEWPDLEYCLDTVAQQASVLQVTLDRALPTTTVFDFYLIAPAAGERIEPRRTEAQPGVFELELELHEVNGTQIELPYFNDAQHYTGSLT